MFTYLAATAFSTLAPYAPILAQESGGNKWKTSLAWFIVLLCVVLGMLVTLNPVKRDKEVKGRKE